mmetsp:Transcript_31557/g.30119  ORF Transcript_31557/g.30119 Transcript_31557/m.30119 type:complete len:154 (-) Transcript_31557:527-988(-)
MHNIFLLTLGFLFLLIVTGFLNNQVSVATLRNSRIYNDQRNHRICSNNLNLRKSCVLANKKIDEDEKEMTPSNFGFTTSAEVINGRIAMAFFAVGIYEETVTGKSILEQAGLFGQDQQIKGIYVAGFFGLLALYPTLKKKFEKLSSSKVTKSS